MLTNVTYKKHDFLTFKYNMVATEKCSILCGCGRITFLKDVFIVHPCTLSAAIQYVIIFLCKRLNVRVF